jgi:N-acylglucosamine-6-phosphate 2-epimerase
MNSKDFIEQWRGGLIVSCQAEADSPLARPDIIAAFALTAERNGAVGVRIEGEANIRAVRELVQVPILGIEKRMYEDSDVYITPTVDSARRVAISGADMIALDGTMRPRPGGETFRNIVERICTELNCPVMADISTYDEGIQAVEEAGVNVISTTLAGYTPETANGSDEPDCYLVERLTKRLNVPVICEGRLRSREHVEQAFESGAFAVVIGTAITGIDWLVRHYVAATRKVEAGT